MNRTPLFSRKCASRSVISALWPWAIVMALVLGFSACEGDKKKVKTDAVPTATIDSPGSELTVPFGLPVEFTGSGSGGDKTLTYAWDFDVNAVGGGPADSTDQDPGDVAFNNAGVYLVRLTVTDGDGDTSTDEVTITVTDPFTGYTTVEDFADDTMISEIGDIDQVRLEVVAGELVASVKPGSASGAGVGLSFPNPETINDFVVDIRIDEHTVTNGWAQPAISGWFYNDGTSSGPGDVTGNIFAQIFVYPTEVYWDVVRCGDADCAWTPLQFGDLDLNSLGLTRTFGVQFDSDTTFTFTADGVTPVTINAGNTNTGPPIGGVSRHIGVGADNPAGETTSTTTAFDNVMVGGVPYDDFSGAKIDLTKWQSGEFVREVTGGSLRFARRELINATVNPFPNEVLSFAGGWTTFQVDVTVDAFTTPAADTGQGYLGFLGNYIDTSGEEVFFGIRIHSSNNNLVIFFFSGKCVAEALSTCDSFTNDSNLPVNQELVPVATLGQTYTLKMSFDHTTFTFQADNGTPVSFVPDFAWASDNFVGFHSGFDATFPTPALTDTEHEIDGRYDNLMMK